MHRAVLCFASITLLACGDAGVQAVNSEPTARIVSHNDGDQIPRGVPVLFQGSASDPNDSPNRLSTVWSVDNEEVCASATPDNDGLTTCQITITTPTATVTLLVFDGDNASDTFSVDIESCDEVYYLDDDEDGYGDPDDEVAVIACEQPDGYADQGGDCDDTADTVNPGAAEACGNGVDDDCDLRVDEGCLGFNCFEDDDVLADLGYTQVVGTLRDTDEPVGNKYRDDFEFEATNGDELALHIWSSAFDTHVELYDPDCVLYLDSADGARGSNAFLQFRVPDTGIWTAVVTSGADAELGQYTLELLDDSITTGMNCARETSSLDLVNDPWTDSHVGTLQQGDQEIVAGPGFYNDDVEFYSFFGDTVVATMSSTDLNAAMSSYSPTCQLVQYNDDDPAGGTTDARLDLLIERTGIYTLTPFSAFQNGTGQYTATATATW